jgi:hypothetical protein
MNQSPLERLVMATRSGGLHPGMLICYRVALGPAVVGWSMRGEIQPPVIFSQAKPYMTAVCKPSAHGKAWPARIRGYSVLSEVTQ